MRIVNALGLGGVAPDVAERIQVAQVDAWAKMSIATVSVGATVAALLWAAYGRLRDPAMALGFAGIFASYGWLLAFCLAWQRSGRERRDVGRHMRCILQIRLVLGACWAVSLITLMANGDALQRTLVFALSIGIISTAAFGGPAVYALSFWLPVTCGSLIALFPGGKLIGVPHLVCLLAYAALTFRAVLSFDKQIIERSLNLVRIERHAETISILLRDFEESSSDWLWETDDALTLRHVSQRFAEVMHRKPDEMEMNLIGLLRGGEAAQDPAQLGAPIDRAVATLQQKMTARLPFREHVLPVTVGTERHWWALTGKPLFDSAGTFLGYRGVGSDITAAQRSRERIAYLARHDSLTDLLNRAGFTEAIAQAVSECHRQPAALLCLDLDEFKAINDSYGHDIGDAVLRAVAQRIRGALRDQDVAARLGGDEFAILITAEDRSVAAAVAARVLENLAPVFACGDVAIRLGASIGIALAPDDGQDPEALYRNADLALYRAKAAGRGTWRLYDRRMDQILHDRRRLQHDVREALPNGELFVAYQPIVDLRSRELVALEALVRWHHPERGLVPPAEFVPIAEQSGLIGAIGTFVLAEAADLARQLPAAIKVAVNLSPMQLRDERLLERVQNVLESLGLPPERIEFEITESVMIETSGRTLENLRGLRSRGHRVAIDDFGTGYSSLSVLRDFPFDRLKIDRSFIADLAGEEGDSSIVKAVIGLGRALGISVIAEGVESEYQAAVLAEYHCASGQGFYFSRPLSPAQVFALFAPSEGGVAGGRIVLPTRSPIRLPTVVREAVAPRRIGAHAAARPRLVESP